MATSNIYSAAKSSSVNDGSYTIVNISVDPMVVLPGVNELISVMVVDDASQPAPAGTTVTWSCSFPGSLEGTTSVTDASGIAVMTVISDQSGISTVTATVGSSSKDIVARFYDVNLAPPFVPNGMDGVLDKYDIANVVQLIVEQYPNANTGDFLTVYWDDIHHYTQEITDLATDFPLTLDVTHNFPPACLNNGSYCVFYEYVDKVGNANVSTPLNLTVTGMTLPPPVFTEDSDGWIDAQEAISLGGTPLAIPAYLGISVGDVVTTYWQGLVDGIPVASATDTQTYPVTSSDLQSGFSVVIPTSKITPVGIGEGQAYYSVLFSDGQSGISPTATINIDTVHSEFLPPPTFPEAVNGELDLSDAEDGTTMQISYPNMAQGDKVTLFWKGYEADGITPVEGSNYSEDRIVSALEAQNQLLSTIIPADRITIIGDGYAVGQYQVIFASYGIAHSSTTEITIMNKATNNFKLDITTGAPYWHSPADVVRPCNVATITALPGTEVEMALPEGGDAAFLDSIPGKPYLWSKIIPAAGFLNASIYSTAPGGVTVTAFDVADVTHNASRVMVFDDYVTGKGDLAKYGFSTGALANGSTVNSLYAWAGDNPDITKVTFTVQGNATIEGYGTIAIVTLSSFRTATVNVVNSTAEHTSFTINTMQSSVPSSVTDSVQFIPSTTTVTTV